MNAKEVVELLTDHLVAWSQVFILTLSKPISRFDLEVKRKSDSPVLFGVSNKQELWLSRKLIGYSVFSLVIGLLISQLIPRTMEAPDLMSSAAITFVYWLIMGSLLHWVCEGLRGTGSYVETMGVCLQVFSTLYVVASVLALALVSAIQIKFISGLVEFIPIFGEDIVEEPATSFFLIIAFMGLFYFPASMKPVHGFGWIRTAILALFPLVIVWVPVGFFITSGLIMGIIAV